MRIWLDERRMAAMYNSVAAVNRGRQMDAIQEHFQNNGVVPVGGGREGAAGYLDCQLVQGQRNTIFNVLSDDLVAAVDVDAADVTVLMAGASIDSFVVQKALSQGNSFAVAQLSRIPASEVMERLQHVSFSLQSVANNTPQNADEEWLQQEQLAQAERELVQAGLISKRDPLEQPPAPASSVDYSKYEESVDDGPSFDIFKSGRAGVDF